MENRLRWLRLQIGLAQSRIKVASDISEVPMLLNDIAEYEYELEDRTLPISEAEKLFNCSNTLDYDATEYTQLTVLVMHRQFRMSKAQLARLLEAKR